METFANMKCNFIKISWGVVKIDGVKVYCELWLNTSMMDLKIKFKAPKDMSVSYVCSAKDAPFEDGQFLSYLVPKNVYFSGATVNELVESVINHLQLKFFAESRKWLTKDERSVASLLAIGSISREDLGWLLRYDVCDIPECFWAYTKAYAKEYDEWLKRRECEDRQMADRLNTPEGLAYMLRMARIHGIHQPAVSFIKELIFDLTELWDK